MKKTTVVLCLLASFSQFSNQNAIAAPASFSFTDSYNNEDVTNAWWVPVSGTWTLNTTAGRLDAQGELAANFFSPVMPATNILLKTNVTVHSGIGGLSFSMGPTNDGFNGYLAGINPDTDSLYLYTLDATQLYSVEIPGLTNDIPYNLTLWTDNASIYIVVADPNNDTLLGGMAGKPILDGMKAGGYTGLFAQGNASFDEFTAAAAPVPLPTAVILFGSGLAGLAGLRARKRQ
jgi:hypothetical protein